MIFILLGNWIDIYQSDQSGSICQCSDISSMLSLSQRS